MSVESITTSAHSQTMEIQFSAYLTKNNRLTSHQSGNKKAHSTETLNILLTDKILEAMDKKQITALALLDLPKAFDSIDHARLLHKLSILGASSSTVKWFKSYLTGRRQYVRIGSACFNTLPITHGVPQGAILSPLFGSAFISTIYPRHRRFATLNRMWMTQNYSCHFRSLSLMLPLKSSNKTFTV